MKIWNRARSAIAGAAVLLLALNACGSNPATGQQSLLGMSEDQEVQVSKQEHPKILAEFGGEYKDPEVQSYISSLGELLAKTSERPDLPWKFTVLDTPQVNAFALPGGYIYITRGLLALASNEAEVASVLAHEIGHVAARHSAQRQGRSTLVGLGAALAGILTGSGEIAQIGNAIGTGYVQKFSRDQELQADTLGVRYMARANYDPEAAVSFLRKMQGETRLRALEAGKDPEEAEQINWMSSHPRTADRVEQAIENAGGKKVSNPIVEQDIYFSKIDGLVYGDDPDQGVVRGRTFIHPALRFEFEVPRGFQVINQPNQVLAQAREGDGLISFGQAKVTGSLRNWFLDHPKAQFEEVERIDVNGMDGATGVTQGAVNGQKADLRVVLIRYDEDTVYQFIFATPPGQDRYSRAFRETTYSFRKLSRSEASGFEPQRVEIVTVRSGDTVESLARRMKGEDKLAEERFRLLNGLDENDRLRPGQKVKIVI
ncbi:MAG: putative Zn-dependent protease [Rhodospirillales bacterium]|jgi:predicted Zn-dependent protease|nr:putative Zn-dependent protease [Rhodospirillales bacterium]